MMSRRETDELIERYCLGQLTPEELRIFEQWRESDPELSQAIDEHRLVNHAFKVYEERLYLRGKIAAIHEEMESEQYCYQAPLKVVEPEVSRLRTLWRRYKVIAVAAIVAVVAVSATIFTFNITGVAGNKQHSAYQELRREVENIKRKQKAMIHDINEKQEGSNDAERTFTGSGFALSKEGHVVTSYHVISDAKLIYISNDKHEQLKMKVVYTNPKLDMAVLKVDEDSFSGFGEIPFMMRKSIADPGEKVYTLGYPREDMVFGEGSVSSYTGYEGDTAAYQISIPVNPGNSGGPLFDNQGNLVGIISGRNTSVEGASFAVKSTWLSEDIRNHSNEKISISSRKSLKGLDRSAQVKKLRDYVFIVKVVN